MKLATLKNETRDGELILVSRDLKSGVSAKDIAPTLQYALDHWDTAHPALKARYALLNENKIKNIFPFETKKVSAPLPRAYQWADASAYVNHVELVRKSRGVTMPESFWTDPLIYQGGSDYFLGPCDDIPIENPDWGIDFEAEIAVITDTIPMGSTANQTGKHIQLLMLVNDISLRNLAPAELAKGFGFFQCKPPTAFSPVAITPDELEDAWDGKKVHLPLLSYYNKKRFGEPNPATDMTFDFPTLLAHAAKTRPLMAGTILGSGTVSNRNYHEVGSSCIVEKRMIETLEQGKPITPFMHYGDTIKIEMQNKRGESIFGEIEQKVIPYVNTL
ncbi:MAG: hypothetical protein ACD_44C00201G0017 [uncultured bacterium]|nr:MAG: hypothetical protein ACD_44C00201G0017 [uncultured bacterium]OGT16176.1 MAG: 2-keto-4-pentenoate hydratase [Gammaproteobacteria bacterium RIFCSPHIGHO2_02_FULL_38_33]OGT23491.1 MAG: 2-keto-4-pentenoate hydratase [Gammaproteobacteria bacterium RIFCSPHIGHO2_12_38_15]OGT69593.1 MAG: 2-keto-4-pentenoate hydratase [Gammaproteobacteria bacterium RIFCSPLOWO2_02_FULL_38_11]OGT75439.1 MAG: 2-keto-4-pentenoate hydratase [Gammaproteobacteria bacterium RIFCSPLOWO2_12_FULL_38_14]